MTTWDEKRRYKRAYIKLPVEYRGKNVWQMVEALDISMGGMFVATNKIEPAQTKIEIMFELGKETKKTIHAEGLVAWIRTTPIKNEKGDITRPAGMGIMFTKLTPFMSKEEIETLVKNSGG